MRNRASLYVGLLLLLFGAFFLVASATAGLHGWLGDILGWRGLWPVLVILVGMAFLLPIAIWWDRRDQVAGFVIPGTIVTVNGLLLLYQNWTGDWGSWAYAWTFEPLAVALGLLLLYYLTDRRTPGLLLAAKIVGGIGIVLFVILASAFNGALRFLGPIALMAVGLAVILRGRRGAHSDS